MGVLLHGESAAEPGGRLLPCRDGHRFSPDARGGDIVLGAVSADATSPFMVQRDTSGTLPERVRVIIIDARLGSE
ncbi:hypothetical protein [Streptomyces thermolilacinus]|uniref:hypothetical protein n=1 Tax=Streptomyces thermolilacinus TaxID=285540 RepID=UPI0033C4BAA3